jgi:hypothetical protein
MCNNWGSTNSVLQDIIATGNIDTNAVIFDRPSGQVLATLSGHSKKVGFILARIAGYIWRIRTEFRSGFTACGGNLQGGCSYSSNSQVAYTWMGSKIQIHYTIICMQLT